MLRFKRDDGTEYPPITRTAIGNIYNPIKGAPLSKADISEEGTPFLLYGELYTRYGEIADEIYRRTDKVVDDKYYSVGGDVVIPTSGETAEDISTATCVVPQGVILAGDLNIYRSDKVNGKFFSYAINHAKKYEIARIAQGASVVHIKADDVAKIEIEIPSPEEQKKIVDCLSSVDVVIADYEAQVENMQNQKKGIMQKLFSQEVRFRKDDGNEFPEWEEKPIGKMMEVTSVKRVHESEWTEEGVPFYRAREIVALHNNEPITPLHISEELYEKNSALSGVIKPGDLLVTGVGSIGVQYLVKDGDRFYFKDGNIIWLKNNALNGKYLYYCYDTSYVKNQLKNMAGKGTVATYTISNAKETKIPVPDPDEQKKIADCLSAFDEAIEDLQKTVEHWKNIKKGLLQQLFV